MNTLILVAFVALVATSTASIHGAHYGGLALHGAIVNPHALSPIGPSGIVTGYGAHGPSGTVTGAGAAGPSGIVTGKGPIGPTGPAGHGAGVVIAAAPVVAAPVVAAAPVFGLGHGAWGAGHAGALGLGHGAYGLAGYGLGHGDKW